MTKLLVNLAHGGRNDDEDGSRVIVDQSIDVLHSFIGHELACELIVQTEAMTKLTTDGLEAFAILQGAN